MNHIFGPVPSRRLGKSLGIDVLRRKSCTYDCLYCECGKTEKTVISRELYFPVSEVLDQLKKYLDHKTADVLTFSGFGEPTLYSGLGDLVKEIRKISRLPLVMITNSSLLHLPEVRNDLLPFDIVLPSLDAACRETFSAVNRPHPEISFEQMLSGLSVFSHQYTGKLWLEILFCSGINDSPDEISKFKNLLPSIRTDEIQINSVDRPPAYSGTSSPEWNWLSHIAEELGGTVISRKKQPEEQNRTSHPKMISLILVDILSRRPECLKNLSQATGIAEDQLEKVLEILVESGSLITEYHNEELYYSAADRILEKP